MGMPVQQQYAAPAPYPNYPTQAQPVMVRAAQDPSQQIIVIQEEKTRPHRACYCRGPRQSPCGCLDPNQDYCCFLVVMAYVLMSLRYILMCLCIWSYCRSFNRGGWC